MKPALLFTQCLQRDFVAPIEKYDPLPNALQIINIRDWHDKTDKLQQLHLKQFGQHCIQDSKGAEFVFKDVIQSGRDKTINASGLNDFKDTGLEEILNDYEDEEVFAGLIGVWTEAKISFKKPTTENRLFANRKKK